MDSAQILSAIAELQHICSVEPRADGVNAFLEGPKGSKLLSALGIHTCIFAYLDTERSPPWLYYLTSDDSSAGRARRNVRWPFRVDDEQGKWNLEDYSIAQARLGLAGEYRRAEYETALEPVSKTLERLRQLARGQGRSWASSLEQDLRVMYAPMGEILAGLLGWHLGLLALPGKLSFPNDLTAPIKVDAPNASAVLTILQDMAAARLLRPDRGELSHFPTIALLKVDAQQVGRALTWHELLRDLGLITPSGMCAHSRLRALASWILAQAVPDSCVRRPLATIHITPEETAVLGSYVSDCQTTAHSWQCLDVIVRALRTAHHPTWEAAFSYGLANHLFWMAAGRNRPLNWVEPYDWMASLILPPLERTGRVEGAGLVTFRAICDENSVPRAIHQRLLCTRALVHCVASVENRLTYQDRIERLTAHELFVMQIRYWKKELDHRIRNNVAGADANVAKAKTILSEAKENNRTVNTSTLHDHLTRAKLCIDEASGALGWTDKLFAAAISDVNQAEPLVIDLREWIGEVVKQSFVAIPVSKKSLQIDVEIPSGKTVSGHIVMKLSIAELLCNAARNAPERSNLSVRMDGEFFEVSNLCKLARTEDWCDISSLASHDGEGIKNLIGGARLLDLPAPQYKVDSGWIHIRLTTPGSAICDAAPQA